MKKATIKFNALILVIIVAHLILNFIFPEAALDGPWSLSHTFSIINGDFFKSTFAHSFFHTFLLPYGMGIFTSVFYLPFAHTNFNIYSIFIVNALFIIILIYLVKLLFEKTGGKNLITNFICLAIVTSACTFLQRPELIEIILIFLFHFCLLKYERSKSKSLYFTAIFLMSFIVYCHVAGGCYAAIFFTLYCFDKKWKFSQWLLFSLFSFAIFLLMFLPPAILDFQAWKTDYFTFFYSDQERIIGISTFLKFFLYSFPMIPVIIFYFINLRRSDFIKEVIYFLSVVFSLLIFGRYYYYFYLIHFFCWRFCVNRYVLFAKWQKFVVIFFICFALVATLFFPMYQILDNKQYASVFKNSLYEERRTAIENPDMNVWVSPYMAMSVIDQKNSRLHNLQYEESSLKMPDITTKDEFFIEHKNMFDYIKTYRTSPEDSFLLTNIIPPVKGLHRFALKDSRSDSLGLWKITVIKKNYQRN